MTLTIFWRKDWLNRKYHIVIILSNPPMLSSNPIKNMVGESKFVYILVCCIRIIRVLRVFGEVPERNK